MIAVLGCPRTSRKEISEPLDEVDKCEVEDNRYEGETVEAEAEPEAQVNENH
jgi:hypothetical protein